jgi:hypothetical protein
LLFCVNFLHKPGQNGKKYTEPINENIFREMKQKYARVVLNAFSGIDRKPSLLKNFVHKG